MIMHGTLPRLAGRHLVFVGLATMLILPVVVIGQNPTADRGTTTEQATTIPSEGVDSVKSISEFLSNFIKKAVDSLHTISTRLNAVDASKYPLEALSTAQGRILIAGREGQLWMWMPNHEEDRVVLSGTEVQVFSGDTIIIRKETLHAGCVVLDGKKNSIVVGRGKLPSIVIDVHNKMVRVRSDDHHIDGATVEFDVVKNVVREFVQDSK